MIGGMIWPLVDAATSIAPALTAGMPIRRMTGIVNVPVVTTLAMEEPEIIRSCRKRGSPPWPARR